jgi:HAD superfamily hydrolase (TIGR01549 family)
MHQTKPHAPTRTIRAVVFDLDGTLVDTTGLILNTYVEAIRLLGGAEVTIDDILANFNIGPTPIVLERFLGRPISAEDLDVYFLAYEAAISKLQHLPGVPDMLERLGREGYQLGLFTSATRRAVSLVLPRAGLDGYFEAIVAGDEVIHPKPAPEGLELVCKKLGVRPEAVAYIGDAEVDLACARSARVVGIQAVWGNAAALLAGDHLVANQPDELIALIKDANSAKQYRGSSEK